MNNLVGFKHRSTLPVTPDVGTFYWIDIDGDTQLWFAYGNTQDKMILLNEKFDVSTLTSKVSEIENSLVGIRERLDEIDLTPYVTNDDLSSRLEGIRSYIDSILEGLTGSDFGDFITREELEEYLKDYVPGIDDSDLDYDEIAEKVKEKLTWQII